MKIARRLMLYEILWQLKVKNFIHKKAIFCDNILQNEPED